MRINKILLLAAILWLTSSVFAASDKKINLAIIADKSSGLDNSPLISLLEVELSQKDGIRLLERTAIDKILEEQQLSATGLLDRNTTIKIGKLLRADAFIILSTESQSKESGDLIRVRVSETAHGLRLVDSFEQSKSSNPKETVERIVQKIKSVLNKINQPDEKLIPIGIVDIHRVQLGEQYKMLERTLPTMLSVRLSLEPQIIMLEREDLKVLLDEKLRTEGKDTKFWNSAILIDGYLQPNSGQLEMHLNLKQAGGDNLKSFTVPLEPNESTDAISNATTEIIQQLQNSPPAAKWQPELEAEAFYKQGKMLVAHSRHEEAISLFEIAHALQSDNVYYTGAIFERIWEIRREIENIIHQNEYRIKAIEERQKNNPQTQIAQLKLEELGDCPYSDMELVELVSVLVRQIRNGFDKGFLTSRDIYDNFSRNLGTEFFMLEYFSSSVSVETQIIKQINQENRKIWFEVFDTALKRQLIDPSNPPMNNLIRARLVWLSSDNPEELIANLKKAFTEFVLPPEMGGKIKSASIREKLFYGSFQILYSLPEFNLEHTYLKGVSQEFLRLWQQYIESLADIDDPFLSKEINLFIAKGIPNLMNDTEKLQTQNEAIKKANDLLDNLTNPNNNFDSKTKQEILSSIPRLLIQSRFPFRYTGTFEERRFIWEKLFNYLIEQKDIDSLEKFGVYAPFDIIELQSHQEINIKRYQFIEQIIQIIKNHQSNAKVTNVLAQLKDIQLELKETYPELDTSQIVNNLPVKMLLTKDNWIELKGFSRRDFQKIRLIDKMLWAAFTRSGSVNDSKNVGIAGINLENGKIIMEQLSDIPYEFFPSVRKSNVNGIVVADEMIYLSIKNAGIIEFIRENQGISSKSKVYTLSSGLPSLLISSICKEANKLWISYGGRDSESGLGIYDLQTEHWETVFCSTLISDTPFGKGKPYVIHSMTLVSPEKMFFLVYDPTIPKVQNKDNPEGLWEMNLKTRELQYLGPLYISQPDRICVEYFSNKVRFKSWSYIIELNPESKKMTKITGDTSWLGNQYLDKDITLELEDKLFLSKSFTNSVSFGPYYSLGNLDLSTGTIHNNKLWARMGESQILIVEKGKSFEEAQIIDNNILEGEPVHRFVSTPYGLLGIGEGIVGLIETESMSK